MGGDFDFARFSAEVIYQPLVIVLLGRPLKIANLLPLRAPLILRFADERVKQLELGEADTDSLAPGSLQIGM